MRAGTRVMGSITRFIEGKLKLKVNRKKSAVSRPYKRTFLGYSFMADLNAKLRVPQESVKALMNNLKTLFREGRGWNLGRFIQEKLNPVLRGWIQYFRLAEVKLFAEDLDKWIRRRLRCIIWRQWKLPGTRFRNLVKCGLSEDHARPSVLNGRGPWWNSGAAHMNRAFRKKYFDYLGLFCLLDNLLILRKASA